MRLGQMSATLPLCSSVASAPRAAHQSPLLAPLSCSTACGCWRQRRPKGRMLCDIQAIRTLSSTARMCPCAQAQAPQTPEPWRTRHVRAAGGLADGARGSLLMVSLPNQNHPKGCSPRAPCTRACRRRSCRWSRPPRPWSSQSRRSSPQAARHGRAAARCPAADRTRRVFRPGLSCVRFNLRDVTPVSNPAPVHI